MRTESCGMAVYSKGAMQVAVADKTLGYSDLESTKKLLSSNFLVRKMCSSVYLPEVEIVYVIVCFLRPVIF